MKQRRMFPCRLLQEPFELMLFGAFWTFAPLVVAATMVALWQGNALPADLAGVIIQALTVVPLAFTFRQRLATLVHHVNDWIHGLGPDKEKTRLYSVFLFMQGRGEDSVRGRALVSLFDLLGLVFLLGYFFVGLLLQHVGDSG